MLIKYKFIDYKNYNFDLKNNIHIHDIIKQYIEENYKTFITETIIYTNIYEIIDNINNPLTRIPIYLNSDLLILPNICIYKGINSFEQNNINLSSKIRNNVIINLINNISLLKKHTHNKRILLGIGGEYYVYQCLLYNLNIYDKYIGITNNIDIYNDCNFNFQRIIKNKHNYTSYYIKSYNDLSFVNSDTLNQTDNFDTQIEDMKTQLNDENIIIDIIINLAKLNINVINFINSNITKINTLIIISCKQKDFNNKIKKFNTYIQNNIKYSSFIDESSKQIVSVHSIILNNVE